MPVQELDKAVSPEHSTGSQKLNAELTAFYERVASDFSAQPQVPDGYTGPFLTSCPDGYADVRFRWMYVGEEGELETLTNSVDVREIMRTHTAFNLAEKYRHKGAPFWSFAHALDVLLNPQGPTHSFIWSNLARVSRDGEAGKAPSHLLDFWSDHRLLANEIELLKPQLVLFVIGNNYNGLLEQEFPGAKAPDVSLQNPVVRISDLPVPALKSYHPRFLRQQKLEERVKREVVEESRRFMAGDCRPVAIDARSYVTP